MDPRVFIGGNWSLWFDFLRCVLCIAIWRWIPPTFLFLFKAFMIYESQFRSLEFSLKEFVRLDLFRSVLCLFVMELCVFRGYQWYHSRTCSPFDPVDGFCTSLPLSLFAALFLSAVVSMAASSDPYELLIEKSRQRAGHDRESSAKLAPDILGMSVHSPAFYAPTASSANHNWMYLRTHCGESDGYGAV